MSVAEVPGTIAQSTNAITISERWGMGEGRHSWSLGNGSVTWGSEEGRITSDSWGSVDGLVGDGWSRGDSSNGGRVGDSGDCGGSMDGLVSHGWSGVVGDGWDGMHGGNSSRSCYSVSSSLGNAMEEAGKGAAGQSENEEGTKLKESFPCF